MRTGVAGFQVGLTSVIKAPSDGIFTLYNSANSDFSRLQFGGTTSSFPAIKRSSAGIAIRLADDSADVVLSVFSPRNFIETERVMKTGAVLILVIPDDDHFVELRRKFNALGIQSHKNENIAASLESFTNIHQFVHKSTELLDGSEMFNSLISGPNGHHIAAADPQMFTNIEPIHVTHCVNISVWKLV
jgi:hypothetical protein